MDKNVRIAAIAAGVVVLVVAIGLFIRKGTASASPPYTPQTQMQEQQQAVEMEQRNSGPGAAAGAPSATPGGSAAPGQDQGAAIQMEQQSGR